MVLPIYAFGHPVLKKVGEDINTDYEGLSDLLDNMWETMYHADGVGLAAPQIGRAIRIFLVDTVQTMKEGEEDKGIKIAFINARIVDESGEPWSYEEGCLSIPNIRGEVSRPESVTITWVDENWKEQKETFKGINARVIQHEYDHIEGHLFTEKLKPLKKKLISRKLEAIKKGNVKIQYRMKFPK
ncbi:MAG: peptide deformylase [Saprospiraceae bacterium]|jgi:peptide deformylase|nr:peptide deformylase [Saprospiraceae bacterium]